LLASAEETSSLLILYGIGRVFDLDSKGFFFMEKEGTDANLSVLPGELNRVCQKVLDNLLKPFTIALYHFRHSIASEVGHF
jgi:hypothetical protein